MRKSFSQDFKVAPTVGKIAEGPNSILSLNEAIMAVTDPAHAGEIFQPMWHLCLACANKRKLIAKVRGDSNDFLNYATLGYVQRWQKQFGEFDARRPVQFIQNWIPYVLGTIRFALMAFNKEAYDYDFLPLPTLLKDIESDDGSDKDIEDFSATKPLFALSLKHFTHQKNLHTILQELPKELYPYRVDILLYLRSSMMLTRGTENFVVTGKAIFSELVEEFVN